MLPQSNTYTLEDLQAALEKTEEQRRVTLAITTEAALNGYGRLDTYEVRVEMLRVHCTMCKQKENGRKLDDFCPVNGSHRIKNDWVVIYREVGHTLSGTVEQILQRIGP